MKRINGCEWWKFRYGHQCGNGWWFQFGPITFDWFRWDAEQVWFEAHCLNGLCLRLRFERQESIV